MKLRGGVIPLRPSCTPKGNVLLSYITDPFFEYKEREYTHTNIWECREMANIFLASGYAVDVIDWKNDSFIPKKNYSYCIDIHSNLERLSPLLNKDCVKIFHATGSHWLFQNRAEYERLFNLQQRKKITLVPRRSLTPSFAIENADLVTLLGNEATENTYRYANKKIFHIPLSTTHSFPFPENKNINEAKKRFVWFGGGGMIHKGLDLVLEAFAEMPEYHLSVCGPVRSEKDFEKAYWKELYETKNIKTFGRIDPGGSIFREILDSSVALVYPSCSEGQSGAVITCLHGGLIPAVSYQSGVNVNDFGIIFKENTIAEIKEVVRHIASTPNEELRFMSKKAWEYAGKEHTRERWSSSFKTFVKSLAKKNS